ELVERATGGEMSIGPYLSYLRNKYGELYRLQNIGCKPFSAIAASRAGYPDLGPRKRSSGVFASRLSFITTSLAIGPRCAIKAISIRRHTCTSAGFRRCPAERSRRSSGSADDIQQRLPPFILYDRHCALQRAGKRPRIVHAFAVAAGGFANLFECRQFSQLNEVCFVAPGRQPFGIHGQGAALNRTPHRIV